MKYINIRIIFVLMITFMGIMESESLESKSLSQKPIWSVLQSDMEIIRMASFSPTQDEIILVGKVKYRTQDKMILQVRNSNTGALLNTLGGLSEQLVVADLQYSGNGDVFGILQDETVHLWNANSKQLLRTIPAKSAFSMGISRDATRIAVSVSIGNGKNSSVQIQILDSITGKVLATLPTPAKSNVYSHPKFSSDGKTLYAAVEGRSNGVIAWDLAATNARVSFTATQSSWGGNFAIHESTNRIFTYEGEKNRYNIFDLKTGKNVGSGNLPSSSANDFHVHPNGVHAFISRRMPTEFITVLDTKTGATKPYRGFMNGGDIDISADGTMLSVAAFFSFQAPQNPSLEVYRLDN